MSFLNFRYTNFIIVLLLGFNLQASTAYDCSDIDHDFIEVSCTGWNNNCPDGFRGRWVEKANGIKQWYCYRELTAEEAAIRADCICAGWTAVCVDMEAERSCDLVMGECSLKYKLQACKILKYDAYCRVLNTLNNVVNPVIGVVN
ncbi:uncharacterized protein LOC110860158 [Folsomia candida]|uniref:Uncharacterized protein n=1 Tax=Folsomia candida TaxID=158441 RepID=A0A226D9G3_FOLCA|nr:uncharacterized protein LOC110860158 [Folsomia candida]OXA41387.1 hypothetical protein Fcan01_23652 [Folsomia candida]